jgi:hypothetical protein
MRVKISRTVRFSAAAGAVSAVFAIVGAPTAFADSSTIDCQGGQIAIDGQCNVPSSMDNTSDALGLPNGTANDVVPSLNQGGYVDQGGGPISGGGGGGAFGGGGGGGGHGR